MNIYLDNAAATDLYPEVSEAMFQAGMTLGNPSSVHAHGRSARALIDKARYDCAVLLGVQLEELIFTSGATESLNLAIIGNFLTCDSKKIFCSPLVHSAVWGAVEFCEKHLGAELILLPVGEYGFLDIEAIEIIDFKEAALVIAEHGNSEIGLVQPVVKLGEILKKTKTVFVVDAAASIVTEQVSLENLNADFVAISGEKFRGPSGSGILLKKISAGLSPIFGGSQEFGYRAGTENTIGIVGLAKALTLHFEKKDVLRAHLLKLHKYTREYFKKHLSLLSITTPEKDFLPHFFHFLLSEGTSDIFVTKCDLAGLSISAGAACTSGSTGASIALRNMGYCDVSSRRGVRISFGRATKIEHLKKGLDILSGCLD